jgi:DNA-binding NtrC family response regulator
MSESITLAIQAPERPQHILIVEDSVALRFTLAEWLRSLNYTVYEAATADEAKTVLASPIIVDLVITDVQMPGTLDGFGLVDHIRQIAPHLNVIVVSGDDTRREINEMGVMFFKKPYSFEAIALHAAKLLQKNTEGPTHEQQVAISPK